LYTRWAEAHQALPFPPLNLVDEAGTFFGWPISLSSAAPARSRRRATGRRAPRRLPPSPRWIGRATSNARTALVEQFWLMVRMQDEQDLEAFTKTGFASYFGSDIRATIERKFST